MQSTPTTVRLVYVPVAFYADCEIPSLFNKIQTKDFSCCVCGEEAEFRFLGILVHGRPYQCPGCKITFRRLGDLLEASVTSITFARGEYRDKAIQLNNEFDAKTSMAQQSVAKVAQGILAAVDAAKDNRDSGSKEISNLQSQLLSAVAEVDRLQRSIQKDTERLEYVKNYRDKLLKKINVLRYGTETLSDETGLQEKLGEDLVRFSFVIKEE